MANPAQSLICCQYLSNLGLATIDVLDSGQDNGDNIDKNCDDDVVDDDSDSNAP